MKQRSLKHNALIFLVIVLFTAGLASGQEDGRTELKVIQLSPDAEPVDVFVDGDRVATGLEFGDLTGLKLDSGTHTIRAESSEINISRTVNLNQNEVYTLAINNRAVNPGTTLLSRDTATTSNRAKLRIAHFSPDLLEVNVETENGRTIQTRDLSYLETGEYVTLPPGDYTLTVSEPRVGGSSFSSEISLSSNTAYTAFIAGLRSGAENQRLRVIPVQSRLETQVDGGNGEEDNGQTGEGDIRRDFSLVCRLEEVD